MQDEAVLQLTVSSLSLVACLSRFSDALIHDILHAYQLCGGSSKKTVSYLLNKLTLSNSFVQRWARQHMGWTWRRSTGAASKLPEGWREEGCKMAKRIAILMETWEVSSRSYWTSCLAHSL
jgi:hypothetical protein